MNGDSSPLDAIRQTLRYLLEEEDMYSVKLSRVRNGIEALTDYLPESERASYLRWLNPPIPEEVEALTVYPVRSRFQPNTTMAEAAETVLKEMGRPMKARELVNALRAWGFPYDKNDDAFHASLGGVLARKAGAGEVFTKPEPGTFGLLAWEEEDEEETAAVGLQVVPVTDTEPPEEEPEEEEEEEDGEDFSPPPPRVAVGRFGGDYEDFQPPPFGDDEDDDLPF